MPLAHAEVGVEVVGERVPGDIPSPSAAFSRWMFACGARETNASVVSRAFRWARWATWSARNEQPPQPRSGQPFTPGS